MIAQCLLVTTLNGLTQNRPIFWNKPGQGHNLFSHVFAIPMQVAWPSEDP